jgi:hypothetical protein
LFTEFFDGRHTAEIWRKQTRRREQRRSNEEKRGDEER